MKSIMKISCLLAVAVLIAAGCVSQAEPKAADQADQTGQTGQADQSGQTDQTDQSGQADQEGRTNEPAGEGYIAQIEGERVLILDNMKEEDIGKKWNELSDHYEGRAIWLKTSDVDSFKAGQKVRYWVDGAVAESFPEQGAAQKIEVTQEADPATDSTFVEPKENAAFRNVQATGSDGQYTVTGEARVFEAVMHYAVSDGHNYLLEESYMLDEGAPEWSAFTLEIAVPPDQRPVNGTLVLELFEYSAKDGSQVNTLNVALESFEK